MFLNTNNYISTLCSESVWCAFCSTARWTRCLLSDVEAFSGGDSGPGIQVGRDGKFLCQKDGSYISWVVVSNIFWFSTLPGEDDPIRRAYFSKRLVQPPTSIYIYIHIFIWRYSPLVFCSKSVILFVYLSTISFDTMKPKWAQKKSPVVSRGP